MMKNGVWVNDLDIHVLMVLSTLSISSYLILPPGNIIRSVLIIILIMFLVGYSIISSLFPQRFTSERDDRAQPFGPWLRMSLSVVLSLVVTSIVAFILNELYTLNSSLFGLREGPVLIVIYIITMLFGLLSLLRRSSIPEERRFRTRLPSFRIERRNVGSSVITVVLVAVLMGSLAYTYVHLTDPNRESSMELYLLGRTGRINQYPRLMTVNETNAVIVGIKNPKEVNLTCSLIISTDPEAREGSDTEVEPYIFGGNISLEKTLELEPGERWEFQLNFTILESGSYTLNFVLIHEGKVIRTVWLRIKVFEKGMFWHNEDGTISIYLTDQWGEPLDRRISFPESGSVNITVNVENEVMDILRLNVSFYLDHRERYQLVQLDSPENRTIYMSEGVVFYNTTILEAFSKGMSTAEVHASRGEHDLFIVVNEFALGCIFRIEMDIY